MKNWKKKGTQNLLESIVALSGDSLAMVSHQISAMLGAFCFGSQQYIEYTKITLPYVFEHKQISPELYGEIMDALTPSPDHIAQINGGAGEFHINDGVFVYLRKRAKKAAENGECSPGITKKFKWIKDMLSEVTFSRRYLKLPVNLVFNNESGTDRIVSMFQPVERSNKPITITDPITQKVEVIRKPFIDNTEIRKTLWRLLSIGILDVDTDGNMFLTKLGAEIASLFVIGMGKNDLKAEEWVYIYSPFLVSKLFEAHFRCLQIRRILSILNELGDSGTIFDILERYGAEGDIENPVWPSWSIPEILSRNKGRLDRKAKDQLYSHNAWDIQGFLDTCVHFGWVTEENAVISHSNGVKEFRGELPRYTLTPAGMLALDLSDRVPKTLVCLEQNIKYPFSGYLIYRRIVVLHAIINGHDSRGEICAFASDLGVEEEEAIIDDVVDDLIRIGFNIQKISSDRGEIYQVPCEMNVSYTSSLKDMRVEKPEFFKRKDADRLKFPMIDRIHLMLCDLADRKKIMTHSRRNQIGLFRVLFADMLKSVDVNCETFGEDDGPDVVVDDKGYVIYVSVEGAFDDDPELGIEKMVKELNSKDAEFRGFISRKSRRLKPYYAYLVRNEETFQAKDEMLQEIEKATGNGRGKVFDFREMLAIFNECTSSVEKGSLTEVMVELFQDKKGE